jgi:hypothetical protein
MFVIIPVRHFLDMMKTKQSAKILEVAFHSEAPLTVAEISSKAKVRYESCLRIVKRLLLSGLLVPIQPKKYGIPSKKRAGDAFCVNFRDQRLDVVFARPILRALALEIYVSGGLLSSRELARYFGLSDGAIRQASSSLNNIDLLNETGEIVSSRIVSCADPLEEISQSECVEVVKYFRDTFVAQIDVDMISALILFGEGASGMMAPNSPLSFLAILRNPRKGFKEVAEGLVEAANSTARAHGASLQLYICSEGVFWDYLWHFVVNPDAVMKKALHGIVVWGSTPRRELDRYYSHFMSEGPPTESKMKDWIARGLVVQSDHGCAFALTAIRVFRRKALVMTRIEEADVMGRKVYVVSNYPAKRLAK